MKKIEAIEKTIYNLENNVYPYRWTDYESCNCGLLAKTILGGKSLRVAGFNQSPVSDKSLSPFCVEAFCITTNLPLPEVFQSLKDAGFSITELLHLENLSDPLICSLAELEISGGVFGRPVCILRSTKEAVIRYLKAWLEILKRDEPKEVQPKVKIRYVSVPSSITEQTKELIMQ